MEKELFQTISSLSFLYEASKRDEKAVITAEELRRIKQEDWEKAKKVINSYSPTLVEKFFEIADRVRIIATHSDLNRTESEVLGSVQSKGSWPRRKRFWNFIRYIKNNKVPFGVK